MEINYNCFYAYIMNIKKVLLIACATTSLLSCSKKEDAIKRPNLLYIFPDQYRLHALSIWSNPEYKNVLRTLGDPVHTPNLDKLAKQGVLFSQVCSTHPVSSPHRAMLMSGMYPSKNGIEDLNCKLGREQALKEDIECFTDVLAKAGYETAYIGKTHWHKTEALFDKNGNYVGTTKEPGGHSVGLFDTYIPEGKSRHSNKYWFQQLNDNHFNAISYSNIPELIEGKKNGELYRSHKFTTKKEADVIIKYLKNENGERLKDKPFSIIWSINPPHPPYFKLSDCDSTIYNKYYKNMPDEELLVRKNVKLTAKAGDYTAKDQKDIQTNARIYFSLIKSVDEEIGRVLNCLKEIGEENNTIVVFTSDHGEMMGSQGLTGKNYIYDESFLVPYIIRYPNKLNHRIEDLMFGSVDIMPTMLGLMGLEKFIPETVMGNNYSAGIINNDYSKVAKPTSALYLRMDAKGVRTNKYSYVVHENGTYELYNNIDDPYQMNNIKLEDINTEEQTELKYSLGKWLKKACDKWFYNKTNNNLIIYPLQ